VNKSGLIDAVSTTTSLTKREAAHAVDAVVHAVTKEVRSGRRVSLVGFGSFNPTQRGARVGRNPQTGAPVKIAAAKGVRFSPSATLKGIVNGTRPLPTLAVPRSPVTKSPTTAKGGTGKALKKTAKTSTKKAVRRVPATTTARTPVGKISRGTPATSAAKRAPARKTAKRSANKAVRRAPATRPAKHAPARKTAKRSAKKAVRRA
jgi:DNA-binding protein HU-beta